jgi:molybdopterin-binding protein
MAISARNQLEGKVVQVVVGDIMAHVDVRIGKGQIESVITRRSAEKLGLKKGDKVTVVIKSTEVMLEKD